MPDEPSMTTTIAFIGLGRMGGPMARHLVSAGYRVQGFDIAPEAIARHTAAGGQAAESVVAAARGAAYVITMLNSDEALQSVVEGPQGLLETLRPPQIFLDMGTSRVGTVRRLAGRLAEHDVPLLDAPVTGGERGAEQASLDIMVGGDVRAFEQCEALFAVLGRRATYVGPSGAGLLAKYVNQIVMAATFCAAAEAFSLVAKGGVEPATAYAAMRHGLAASPLLDATAQAIFADSYGHGAELALLHKDTAYALQAASDFDAWLPITAQAHEAFKLAMGAGFGGGSAMGVARVWERISGVTLQTEPPEQDP